MKWVALIFLCFSLSPVLGQKIDGVNLVSNKYPSPYDCMPDLKQMGAGWIALCPFALMESGATTVTYNTSTNWYGDRKKGLVEQIVAAKQQQLKVFIKPHVWVKGEGWPGEYSPGKRNWKEWENNYTAYLTFLAGIADSLGVEMLSLGTEFKRSIKENPAYWSELIQSIRSVYKGKLTYAANWDNYESIPFWSQLDYISIDAYFPLVNKKTPTIENIESEWRKVSVRLQEFSTYVGKQIIFTEYGYRSIDVPAFQQWLVEGKPSDVDVNLKAQVNSYQGFYNAVWNEDWFAGGFIWKWFCSASAGGVKNSNYTPQGKPVMQIIENIYQ